MDLSVGHVERTVSDDAAPPVAGGGSGIRRPGLAEQRQFHRNGLDLRASATTVELQVAQRLSHRGAQQPAWPQA